ncbi:ZnF_CDGSH domain-containing protein [Durusdinium trenchii]|uniref:ZnF_CDGSH domain-containing protein n=1 Tax=Durusdinium trenchii TaxID=1381693 RepID=A0ABP0IKG6_9DINO
MEKEGEAAADSDEDPFAYAKAQAPTIELLPPGQHGKKFPYRCTLCVTKTWPEGKVGDCCAAKTSTVKHFISQHINSQTHQMRLKRQSQEAPAVEVDCEGLPISDAELAGHLYTWRTDFTHWAGMASFGKYAKHTYWYVASEDSWYIRAQGCSKRCEYVNTRNHQCCKECIALGSAHSVVRSVARFSVKFFSARLLCARLFQGSTGADAVEKEICESQLYAHDPKKMRGIMQLESSKLQQFVRASFLSESPTGMSSAARTFNASVVSPCLQCRVDNVPEQLADVVARFDAIICGGQATEQDTANIKIAAGALSGSLEGHPLIHGLSLQCFRQVSKLQKGIETMRGRRSKESALEEQLIRDAGLQLSMASGNKELAQMFGLAVGAYKTALDELEKNSLPNPALSLLWPEKLANNFRLIDQRSPSCPDNDRCRFLLAFDCTYLTQTLTQMAIHDQHAMVGGIWSPQTPENACISLDTDEMVDVKGTPLAATMMECLVWDPSLKHRISLSPCSMPIQHNFQGVGGMNRGQWYMVDTIGRVMEGSDGLVRGLVCDAHSSHAFIGRIIFGHLEGLDAAVLREMPWFNKIVHIPMPKTTLPRLPIRIAKHDNKTIWFIPGICHASKNSGGQLCSHLRTLWYGRYSTDMGQARQNGLPPAAFGRESAMSDRLQALLSNPFFLDGPLNSLQVGWSSKGALIHNLVVGLVVGAALHTHISLAERAEWALTGFCCLDLFKMLASERCEDMGLPKGSCYMAGQTVASLQNSALSTALICFSKEDGWNPWRYGFARASELPIEHWFSYLRGQSKNSQLTARSFWYASARQLMRNGKALNKVKTPTSYKEPALAEEEFIACSDRALKAALALASKCSGVKEPFLEASYRKLCEYEGSFQMDFEPEPDEMEFQAEDAVADQKPDCLSLLTRLQEESRRVMEEAHQTEEPNAPEPTQPREIEVDLQDLPDKAELIGLCEKENVQCPFRSETSVSPKGRAKDDYLPSTLTEALQMKGDMWNNLFRLVLRIRSTKGGCDVGFLRNARNCRRAAKTLNWHQYNERKIAAAVAEKDEVHYRSRAGRLEKWRELCTRSQKELQLPVSAPERLMPGNCVIFIKPKQPPEFEIGMVLTVWKGIKNPRQFGGEVPINSISAFRVLVLDMKSQEPI